MKILFLTQIFPYPPVCGGTIRSYNLLRHLGPRHDVTLVSFVRKEPTAEQMQALDSLCSDVRVIPIRRSTVANLKFAAKSLVSRIPFIVARDEVAAMQKTVDGLMKSGRFDLVYVDHLQMAQYVANWRGCPKVLDEHNVEWKIIERIGKNEPLSLKRIFAEIEWRKLRKWELKACEEFDIVFTVTENDRQTLASEHGDLDNLVCLPIGVDFNRFPRVELRRDARDIVSIGTMSWPPNIDATLYFAREIYPLVRARAQGVRFVITGSNPPESVRSLPSDDESIAVTGFVEDIASVASHAAVFVVPLRSGSGLRVKILNALAMGLPVVSTSVGCEGIGAEHGRHLLIADGEEEFADAVVRLLSDFDLRKRLAEEGRAFVEANYSWDNICLRLDETLEMIQEKGVGSQELEVRS